MSQVVSTQPTETVYWFPKKKTNIEEKLAVIFLLIRRIFLNREQEGHYHSTNRRDSTGKNINLTHFTNKPKSFLYSLKT